MRGSLHLGRTSCGVDTAGRMASSGEVLDMSAPGKKSAKRGGGKAEQQPQKPDLIAYLPCVKEPEKPGGGRNFWTVTRTGDYQWDCIVGQGLAVKSLPIPTPFSRPIVTPHRHCLGDRRKFGGQAAIAGCGCVSLAGWNFCP
jgi:hypothetical protein